jgi:type VI secretion system protein ImpI
MAAGNGGSRGMSLLLTLEQGPRTQPVRETRLDTGKLVIGRSPEADWQIQDPDMFVSRAHCTITAAEDGYFVTDTSSSGLFLDGSAEPLGAGNSARLRNGMRLRLGEYVVWVDLEAEAAPPEAFQTPQPASRGPVDLGGDDFFSLKVEDEPKAPRPADLPDPFEHPEPGAFAAAEREAARHNSPAFDDPFSLDPVATPPPPQAARFNGGGHHSMAASDAWTDAQRAPQAEPRRAPTPEAAPPKAPTPASDAALRAAFLRGMGLDSAEYPSRDSIAEMERFGREYRMMMEGLMQLLRKRADEKGNARVAQTVVGASDVNPLKFLPTVDDVLGTMLADRSPGFLASEPAIADAIRDLAQHHVRAWRGVQGALRKMIDRFDPALIEEELKSSSAMETLLAGGRSAKLWELYQKRHRELALSAESRFMGEIGADFRNAYEGE